ncbi:MAG: (2Fe-2S)-binding protein, partial [Micromonosporaceae bacterium]
APPSGPGWLPYSALDELLGRVAEAIPGASATVAAALLATSMSAGFAAPVTGALLTDRHAPVPDPDDVWLHHSFTGVDAVAIGRCTLTVLPDDPLASRPDMGGPDMGGPGVAVAADLDELRRVVLDGYRAMLVPLVDRVAASTKRGRRALWADAGDRLATYLLLAGRARGDQAVGRAEADALLRLAEPPVRHDPAWLEFEHRGATVIWKRRPVCCLVYQVPEWRGQLCATCPKVSTEETVTRTRDWLG